MRQEQHDRSELERQEADDAARLMDRQSVIAMVSGLIASGVSAELIVDAVIEALTPEDGDECPVCGICP